MASDIKLHDNGVVVEGGELHNAGPAGGFSFDDRTKGNPERWVLYAQDGKALLWSQVSGDRLAIQSNGNVGIGTKTPVRSLHVEGGEIHSGGPVGGFSFSDRAKPAFVDVPQNGERWVWYAHEGKARLWSGRDVLVIDDDGPRDGGLPELRIHGDMHVGGKLSGGHVSRLDGIEASYPAPTPIKRVAVYANKKPEDSKAH